MEVMEEDVARAGGEMTDAEAAAEDLKLWKASEEYKEFYREYYYGKVGWTGAKGAREIFLSFFLLWPKIFFCGIAGFRQF